MARTDGPERDRERDDDRVERRPEDARRSGLAAWFAESTIRIAIGVLGVVLLLFAVGQMVGLDLLGAIAAALETSFGRWLLVAAFALLLIALALRGFYAQPD